MIYESAVVLRHDAGEAGVTKLSEIIAEVTKTHSGEVLLKDDWGVKTFAQPTSNGVRKGHYVYFIYNGDNAVNKEIDRRLKIDDDVLKSLIVALGPETEQEKLLKAYVKPGQEDPTQTRGDKEKEKRMFARKKTCWFSAKKVQPDWKDPSTYSWLVNEFGKISPARVSGITAKYQRAATTAIKRGRHIGLLSYMSSRVTQ